jgi:heparan-alpha-glucosaminide N-acetyltransferase-like protein
MAPLSARRYPAVNDQVRDVRTSRIIGIDGARAVALAGMVTVHILPILDPTGGPTAIDLIAGGRSSALFGVLAGVGVALSAGGRTPVRTGHEHAIIASGLLSRAFMLGIIGTITVAILHPSVPDILLNYAVLFAVASALLRLCVKSLLWLGGMWSLLGPCVSYLLRQLLPFSTVPVSLHHPVESVMAILLTGPYPVLQWTAYLLVGMAVGRLDFRRPHVAFQLVGFGIAIAVFSCAASQLLLGPLGGAAKLGASSSDALVLHRSQFGTTPTNSWWWLSVVAPHSGTPLDLANMIGCSLAIIGLCLAASRTVPGLMKPLALIGSVPITLYTLHLLAMEVFPHLTTLESAALLVGHAIVAVAMGLALRAMRAKGPLEWCTARVSKLTRNAMESAIQHAPSETEVRSANAIPSARDKRKAHGGRHRLVRARIHGPLTITTLQPESTVRASCVQSATGSTRFRARSASTKLCTSAVATSRVTE